MPEHLRLVNNTPAASRGPAVVAGWRALRPSARLYIGGVTALGGIAAATAVVRIPAEDVPLFAILCALTLVTSIAKITLPVPRSGSTLSICYVIDFTTLLLLGPDAATLTAALGAWSQCTFRQRQATPAFQTWFSVAALALTVRAAAVAYSVLGGEPGLSQSVFHVDAMVAASVVFFLANSLLVAAAVALSTQLSTLTVWRSNYLWSWPGHLLGFSLAVGAAVGVGRSGLWILPFALVSLALTYENFNAYVTRFTDSITDALTGLPNVRYLTGHAAQELERARRSGSSLALMLIDLDGFKSINDTYGHHAGDVALREVGASLQQSIRSYDLCARYGGDEFVAVLPGCGVEDARRKAAALQSAVATLAFEPKPGVKAPLRISAGVAIYPADGESFDALLASADARMFEDKGDRAERAASPVLVEPSAPGKAAGATPRDRDDRVLQERLLQAQRMEAIGQLAGGVAHDFNNVLTAILGYSELLTEQIGPDKPIGRDLQEILGAARHAAALTHQLLAFSRSQDRVVGLVDLNEVVGASESLLRRLISERIAITTKLSADLCSLMADATQLEQIVINLSVNARDAMVGGGALTIETRNVDLGGGNPYVELIVSDTGSGIPPEIQSKIFQPFFTTKDVGKGTGLGLAAVHSIVTQMQGGIRVESAPERGTTFRIHLPSTGVAARRSSAPTPFVSLSVPVGAETILLVEDEAAVRQFATIVLERHGYRVLEAHSGEAALTLLDRLRSPIHLLMTDLVLPGIDGCELAARAELGRPRPPVLFTTGYSERLQTVGSLDGPDMQLLEKPFTAQALLTKTRELLDLRVA
ncbi:MAG TPA: diguanylate cyclase [Vicinamibacterales bacterium]|jgi:diguanylate cyclase (GGDEF)-like protein|nr:diguanylate cyclase [Vicinamibacterales bacterium]